MSNSGNEQASVNSSGTDNAPQLPEVVLEPQEQDASNVHSASQQNQQATSNSSNNRRAPPKRHELVHAEDAEDDDDFFDEDDQDEEEDEPLLDDGTTAPVNLNNNTSTTQGAAEQQATTTSTTNNSDQQQQSSTAQHASDNGTTRNTRRRRRPASSGSAIVEKYSISTLSLIKPVCIAMVLVIWAIKNLSPIIEGVPMQSAIMVYQEKADDSVWLKIGGAILNAIIVVVSFVVITLILVILYKYRCMKIIFGWLIFSCSVLLFFMGWVWLELFLQSYGLPMDYFTYFFLLFNFALVGIVSIFWRAHKTLTQAYLIMCSAMTAWWLTRLPEWTSWAMLAAVAIYDVIAVLTPKGPLNILVQTAQERGEPIPGLIYEGTQFKLGLGDFVFYSMLVGRASMYDFTTMAVCFVCVLTGLCMTLFILGIFRRALPALPISIALGIIFYFVTRFVIHPFVLDFSIDQVYV